MKLKTNLIRLLFIVFAVLLVLQLRRTIIQHVDISQEISIFQMGLYIVASIDDNILLVALYITAIIIFKRVYKIKYDKNDLKKYEGYYRDIIKQYNPGVLSYIDEFKVNESTVIATIMNLEKKGIVSSFNNKIEIVNIPNEGLSNNEKYILNVINNNSLNSINYNELSEMVISDCLNYGFLEEKQSQVKSMCSVGVSANRASKRKKISLITIILLLQPILLMLPIIAYCVVSSGIEIDIDIIKSVALIIAVFGVIFGVLKAVSIIYKTYMIVGEDKLIPYIRTKEAKNINENLEGLKNYIKDFSNLKEKDKEALTLWNEYLIYSVMFGQNTKIIEEYKAKF